MASSLPSTEFRRGRIVGLAEDSSNTASSLTGLPVTVAVPNEEVLVGPASFVSKDATLDFLRRPLRMTRRTRFDTVSRERLESSESESDDELESELEESSQAAAGPGVDSSSMMCCGVDSYMYAWDLSWKLRMGLVWELKGRGRLHHVQQVHNIHEQQDLDYVSKCLV